MNVIKHRTKYINNGHSSRRTPAASGEGRESERQCRLRRDSDLAVAFGADWSEFGRGERI